MEPYCQNHRGDNPFMEKRLVFRRPAEAPSGGAESMEEILARMEALRKRTEASQKRKKEEAESGTDKGPRYYWGDVEERPKYNQDTEAAIREAIRLEGRMSDGELTNMENAHDIISKHYMSPAFMLTMRSKEGDPEFGSEEIYKAFDDILSNPYEYHYQYDGDKKLLTIRRRSESKAPQASLVIQIGEGTESTGREDTIVEVNGHSLRNKDGRLPWQGHQEYYGEMVGNYQQLIGQYRRFMLTPALFSAKPWRSFSPEERREAIAKIRGQNTAEGRTEALTTGVAAETKKYFVHNNVTLPLRLMEMIRARDYDFETRDNPAYQALLKQEKYLKEMNELDPAEAYAKIIAILASGTQPPVLVMPDPDLPGVYNITVNGTDFFLVNEDGYMMVEDGKGNWIINPAYNFKLRSDYRKKYKDKYTDAEIAKDTSAKSQAEAEEQLKEIRQREYKRKYMQTLMEPLARASWEKISEITIGLAKDEDKENLKTKLDTLDSVADDDPNKVRARESLLNTIIAGMQDNPDIARQVAEHLEITLPEYKEPE